MYKAMTLSMILATAVGCASLAYAGPGDGGYGHGHRPHRGMGMGMGFRELHQLDLTDAQKGSIRQMVQQSFADHKTARQALQQQRMDFEAMTPDAAGYQSAAASLAQAEANAARDRVMQQATLRSQVYGLLTDTQRTKLASLKAAHLAKMQQRKARHEAAPDQSSQ